MRFAGPILVALVAVAPRAQSLSSDPFEVLPAAPEAEAAPEPMLRLGLVAEIPLPGPLPGAGPRWTGREVEVPVAGGVALVPPEPGAEARVSVGSDTAADPAPDGWVQDSAGRRRYAVDERGWLRAQRRCPRCTSGWKGAWKLRAAGAPGVPPLLVEHRVCFGSLDNRVQCVRARNGHRTWSVEVGGRVRRPLALWCAVPAGADINEDVKKKRKKKEEAEPPEPTRLLLAVLDQGSELLLLAASDGHRVAALKLPPSVGALVGVPLTTPDGLLVLARQDYAESAAALLVYRVESPPPARPRPEGEPAVLPEPAERDAGSLPEPGSGRTTTSVSPASTSAPSRQRISTTSASPGSPGAP